MFKAYVNFNTFFNHCRTFKKISNSGYELKPFDDYFMSFGCKTGSESAEARESNKINLNTGDISVMHIVRVRKGDENRYLKRAHY